METRFAVIHICFPYETRMDDELDQSIQDKLQSVYSKFEYIGSETELDTMEKTSTYVIKYTEDVEHIIDDVLFELVEQPIFKQNDIDIGWLLGMTEKEAKEEGYYI